MKIKHKFRDHKINSKTKILIIGTFNPDVVGNEATFFYGRNRNFLWSLLPKVFNEESLKSKQNRYKLNFIRKYKIDFIDLISEIEIEEGKEKDYSDEYIDSKILKWNNVIEVIKNKHIEGVCFTRKTFSKINNIKNKIEIIEKYCEENNIKFSYLETPARYENAKKLNNWKRVFG